MGMQQCGTPGGCVSPTPGVGLVAWETTKHGDTSSLCHLAAFGSESPGPLGTVFRIVEEGSPLLARLHC